MTWKLSDGDWCHVEIPAKDIQRQRQFYGEVFGWKFMEYPGWEGLGIQTSPDGIESSLGTLGQEGENQQVVAFILVKGTIDDMRRKAEEVQAAGGKMVKEPVEIPGIGNFAYLADPEGCIFGFWQDAGSQGEEATPEEPHTHDDG